MDLQIRTLDGLEVRRAVVDGRWAEPGRAADQEYDLRHGYAVAGLVDAHAHLTGSDVDAMVEGMSDRLDAVVRGHAGAQVDAGVLMIADKGSRTDSILDLSGIDHTERPIVHSAGPMVTTPGGYYEGFARELAEFEVDSDEWIDDAATPGASWLKLVGDWPRKGEGVLKNFTREQLTSIVARAHDRGLRVAIHAAGPAASDAVAAGVDSIEHGLFLTEDDLRDLGSRGGAWVPTVLAMEGVRATMREGSSGERILGEGLDKVRQLLPLARQHGVTVLAGTDLYVPHGAVAREGLRLAEYGLPPDEVVQAMTTAGYDYLGTPRDLGPGSHADLVVFRGDPRDDLRLLTNPMFIMRAGRVVHVG